MSSIGRNKTGKRNEQNENFRDWFSIAKEVKQIHSTNQIYRFMVNEMD